MEGAGLLGDPPLPLQSYPNLCFPSRPPLFRLPWQYREEMHLMHLQNYHPPFGMQPLTTEKKRRRRGRNTQRTSWIGDGGHHQNLGMQINFRMNGQPTINIAVGTQQQTNIVVKNTENRYRHYSQDQNYRQKIRKPRPSNLSLEEQMLNRPKLDAALRRKNRCLQHRFTRRQNSVDRRSRRYGVPSKPGMSPLLRDKELDIPRTSQLKPPRKFRNRRKRFRNPQNRGEIEQQHRGVQDSGVKVTEMDEEDLEFVDEVVETDKDEKIQTGHICSYGALESQVLLSA